MLFQSYIGRIDRHARLFDKMLVSLGLRDSMAELNNVGPVYRRATMRCVGCDSADKCVTWLDEHEHAQEAPEYCRNRALLHRLRQDLPDLSKRVAVAE